MEWFQKFPKQKQNSSKWFQNFLNHFAGIVQNIYQKLTVGKVSENSETVSDYAGLTGSVNFWNHSLYNMDEVVSEISEAI